MAVLKEAWESGESQDASLLVKFTGFLDIYMNCQQF